MNKSLSSSRISSLALILLTIPAAGSLVLNTDTQISRLGGPNFHEIPINRPTCPYHNFQRDGMHRMDIDTNPANYEPNSINDNWPRETPPGPTRWI